MAVISSTQIVQGQRSPFWQSHDALRQGHTQTIYDIYWYVHIMALANKTFSGHVLSILGYDRRLQDYERNLLCQMWKVARQCRIDTYGATKQASRRC